jgi:hypothetical protein
MVCLTDQQEHKNACLHIPLTSAAVPQIKTITPSIFKLLSSLTFCAMFNHQCHVGPGLQRRKKKAEPERGNGERTPTTELVPSARPTPENVA